MLDDIGSLDNVPAFIESVKAGEGRLMGFGHRVYKNYDPAAIIKDAAYDVFEVTGKNPLDIALTEEVALSDSYFVDRKLYPNVDFYSGLITNRWAPSRCSRCCSSRSAEPRAGWLTGTRCSSRTRIAAPASGTPVPTCATARHRRPLSYTSAAVSVGPPTGSS